MLYSTIKTEYIINIELFIRFIIFYCITYETFLFFASLIIFRNCNGSLQERIMLKNDIFIVPVSYFIFLQKNIAV